MTATAQKLRTEFADISPLQAHARVQKGISLSEVTRFARRLELTQEEAAGLVGVPLRTWQRWLSEPGKKLDPATGGRFYRTLKIILKAEALLGSVPAALQWLRTEQRALGFQVPFSLLSTAPGAEAVEDLLGRIEYGVIT